MCLEQWSWASSIGVTPEFVRNINSCGVGSSVSFNQLPGDSDAHWSLRTTSQEEMVLTLPYKRETTWGGCVLDSSESTSFSDSPDILSGAARWKTPT